MSPTPQKFAIRHVHITECKVLKVYDVGVASRGIMFLKLKQQMVSKHNYISFFDKIYLCSLIIFCFLYIWDTRG